MRRLVLSVLAAAAFLPGAALAQPAAAPPAAGSKVQEFKIEDAWGRDTVQFRTTAPLEDIVGTMNAVTGVLRADPTNLQGPGTSARVQVALSSVRTGIEMRDGHVAKALGADQSPNAVFTLEKIRSASATALTPNVPVDVVADGVFELKGVRKPVTVKARLTWVPRGSPFNQMRPGSFVKVVADFDVALADYGVERKGPVLPLQVGETAHVTVTALASDATPEEARKYRESAVQYMGKAAN
jgi:polyisoprenoid-binding protein YceI